VDEGGSALACYWPAAEDEEVKLLQDPSRRRCARGCGCPGGAGARAGLGEEDAPSEGERRRERWRMDADCREARDPKTTAELHRLLDLVAAAASVDSSGKSVPARLVRIRRSQRRTRERRSARKRIDQKDESIGEASRSEEGKRTGEACYDEGGSALACCWPAAPEGWGPAVGSRRGAALLCRGGARECLPWGLAAGAW